MTRVLLTGITGFIGSHLASVMVERGYDVYGVMRPSSRAIGPPLSEILNKVSLLTADIGSLFSISRALKKVDPDYVCHTATLPAVRYSFEHPFQYAKSDYIGTMNVAHALMEMPGYQKRRLVFPSSGEVYFETEKLITEDEPYNPINPYGVAKAAAEMYLKMAARIYDLNCVILRPTNTYGRKVETGYFVEYVVTSILMGEKVYVGAPDYVRDYMYIDDHVNAYVLAMESEKARGQVYNVSSGKGTSNKEVALRVSKITGYDFNNVVLGAYPPGYPRRPLLWDPPQIVADHSKITWEIGWKPKVSLDEGLKRTIKYWEERI